MTCIVALVENGTVYMGADSAGVAGWDMRLRKDPKIYRVGEMLIGYTSSFRMGQLLGYAFTPPKHHDDISIDCYMVTVFIDAVRQVLKSGGFASKDKEVEGGGHFLVGYRGRLFHVNGDYQVAESLANYDATGCGEGYALGVLYATQVAAPDAPAPPPGSRLRIALEAAERFSAGVRGPFIYEHIDSIKS